MSNQQCENCKDLFNQLMKERDFNDELLNLLNVIYQAFNKEIQPKDVDKFLRNYPQKNLTLAGTSVTIKSFFLKFKEGYLPKIQDFRAVKKGRNRGNIESAKKRKVASDEWRNKFLQFENQYRVDNDKFDNHTQLSKIIKNFKIKNPNAPSIAQLYRFKK